MIGFLFAVTLALSADRYEFPEGVPFRAADVTWYAPTEYYQNDVPFTPGNFLHFDFNGQSWNREFPWKTGGLDHSPADVTTFKFYVTSTLSPDQIQRWRHTGRFFSNAVPNGYLGWKFPKGAIVGEVITVAGRTVEVGTIEFTGAAEPKFHKYAPFGTREDIADWIASEQKEYTELKNQHSIPGSVLTIHTFKHHVALKPGAVDAILGRPYKDVIDVPFSTDGAYKCFGPTATQAASIVPMNSQRGHFDSKACLACHRTAGMEGRLLDPNPTPDKYGTIRGGGFVFSLPTDLVRGIKR